MVTQVLVSGYINVLRGWQTVRNCLRNRHLSHIGTQYNRQPQQLEPSSIKL
ncbi:hypothetical protein H6G80_04920 [Nostoc sp. FACHB-87]|uniref:hypothetical protein n=1 Tax=Nostocales TaxID=1161 RepID=UPI0016831968|nr:MULTISPECIES: hypothetical protein [Nostocales]MBD2453414.1 hypothetical protein [Nostoc sp. FACHB-87]MBD2475539.1 hypothetical protein [Anabaena sp. FACHB-83]MBD2490309.1 hypothetical protein [Aulosira sp. FACHB-615]